MFTSLPVCSPIKSFPPIEFLQQGQRLCTQGFWSCHVARIATAAATAIVNPAAGVRQKQGNRNGNRNSNRRLLNVATFVHNPQPRLFPQPKSPTHLKLFLLQCLH